MVMAQARRRGSWRNLPSTFDSISRDSGFSWYCVFSHSNGSTSIALLSLKIF